MTLKSKPVQTTYFIDDTALEQVETIRDLGVILDEKLTFGHHVDSCVKKANRALGVLFRTFQKSGARGGFKKSSIIVSFNAHVRSILEYCSVIWNGAAKTHMERVERVQHKFLLWLNFHIHQNIPSPSLSYSDLLNHFNIRSLKARRVQHDLLFVRNVFNERIDSSFLLQSFSLAVPARVSRQPVLLHVPFARVNTVRDGLFVRIPRATNAFLRDHPTADLFHDCLYSYRVQVVKHTADLFTRS